MNKIYCTDNEGELCRSEQCYQASMFIILFCLSKSQSQIFQLYCDKMSKRKEPETPKRTVLTLERRLNVLKDIDAKLTARDIAAKYGISVGTVANIKKTRSVLVHFSHESAIKW